MDNSTNPSPVIIWDPEGGQFGIGDRLRGIAAGMALAEKLNGTLLFRWEANGNCSERFEELFRVARVSSFSHPDEISHIKNPALRMGFRLNPTPWEIYPLLQGDPNTDLFSDFEEFFGLWQKCVQRIFPHPSIAQRIEVFADTQLTSNTVGIHLRRTDSLNDDHRPINKENVSLYDSALMSEIMAIRQREPDVRFFLASDHPGYFEQWISRLRQFGIDIVGYEKQWRREYRQTSSEDAVMDMFLLSRCTRIIASIESSILLFAATISGIERKLVAPKEYTPSYSRIHPTA